MDSVCVKSKSMAKLSIKRYFSEYGVFNENLLSDKYVNMCMETEMCSGVDKAYELMSGFFDNDDTPCPIEKEVRFVIRLLEKMSRLVPQEFSAGILLMHLEIIEGLKFEHIQHQKKHSFHAQEQEEKIVYGFEAQEYRDS